MTVSAGRIEALLNFPEYVLQTDGNTDTAPHRMEYIADFSSGTGANQHDLVYGARISLAAAPVTIDLIGSLTRALGLGTLSMLEVVGFGIKNLSTTTAETVLIGNATNPFSSWVGSGSHAVRVGASGILIVTAPIDGFAAIAGSNDEVKFDPSSDTFDIDVLFWGRSA